MGFDSLLWSTAGKLQELLDAVTFHRQTGSQAHGAFADATQYGRHRRKKKLASTEK